MSPLRFDLPWVIGKSVRGSSQPLGQDGSGAKDQRVAVAGRWTLDGQCDGCSTGHVYTGAWQSNGQRQKLALSLGAFITE